MRKLMASLALGGILFVAPPASTQDQDGLVNVAIGDVTIQDINIGVAAQIIANVCGVNVGPVAVLGAAIDRSGGDTVVCTADAGDVTLSQN